MRSQSRRLWLVAAMFAIAVAFTATTLAGAQSEKKVSPWPAVCNNNPQTIDEFRPFSEKVWDQNRWHREEITSSKVIESERLRLKCAASKTHLRAMQKEWRQDKAAFMAQRKIRIRGLRIREHKEAVVAADAAWLASTRSCESGGNYSTNTGNGFYGAYQFTWSTWESVGGHGNPAYASKLEQDYRAALLHASSGTSPWPVCG